MLVLSRKAGQSIKIGDDVTVHVIQMNSNQVRIGIDAPDDVLILRSEVKKHDDNGDGDLFKYLTDHEVENYKLWAHMHYKAGDEISELWHPVVRAECKLMNRRAKGELR
jgi:carbon storage regulator